MNKDKFAALVTAVSSHPVIDAMAILRTYIESHRHTYPLQETIPIDMVVPPA